MHEFLTQGKCRSLASGTSLQYSVTVHTVPPTRRALRCHGPCQVCKSVFQRSVANLTCADRDGEEQPPDILMLLHPTCGPQVIGGSGHL